MKIDPYHYPITIILAFVIGLTLALALGFTHRHGKREGEKHSFAKPALGQAVPALDIYGL
jgi:hypothetical protein